MNVSAAEKAYKPDQESRKELIVVGLSGGVKSYVTASLLKIQKYDVIGVTVQNEPQGFQGPLENIVKCHANEQKLDEIRLFCRSLGIPHFVAKTGSEFQESVVETWKSSRVEGNLSRQCHLCHGLRMKILHREMIRLGAKKLATGHLGKIFVQNDNVFLRSSNDEKNDQSGLLSELPESVLMSLLLPLSDLQYSEILRLAENFSLKKDPEGQTKCFPNIEATAQFLEKTIPPGIRKPGSLVLKNGDKFNDHEGVQSYIFGESVTPKDAHTEHIFVEYDYPSKDIILGTTSDFLTDDFFIEGESLTDLGSLAEPSTGFIRLEGKEIECWISPKSLGRIHVQLKEKKKVISGETISIFRKPGRNSKLLITGRVTAPVRETGEEEGELNEKSQTSFTQFSR